MSAGLQKTPEQIEWFAAMEAKQEPNPCRRIFGHGPEGKRCKECSLLFARRMSKTYYKCQLRGDTHGPGTDHKVNWLACGKFEEKKPA